jgi:predicted permease
VCGDGALHQRARTISTTMSTFLLLAICLALGFLAARFGNPPPMLARGLNWWILNIALPATVLLHVPRLDFDWGFWYLVAAMWFVLLGAWAFFSILGRALGWSAARIGALTLVCGLGNTAFIGFPLIEALRGAEGLKLAVVADQAGTFLAFAIGGAVIAAVYSGAKLDTAGIARRVVYFPPFICLVIALIAGQMGGWPEVLPPALERLSATLTPLALFSCGLQFQLKFAPGEVGATAAGLSWKLLLAPLIVYAGGSLLGVSDSVAAVSVLEAAMAPMISAAVLAEQHGLEPALANTVAAIGIIVSFFTVPFANGLL